MTRTSAMPRRDERWLRRVPTAKGMARKGRIRVSIRLAPAPTSNAPAAPVQRPIIRLAQYSETNGAIIEVSTNAGTTWTQIGGSALLTDPYNGLVSTSFSNPLGGSQAWCGNPQAYLNSVVDLTAYAGQTVQFRFRLANDSSLGQPNPGWAIDDVKVAGCATN